MFYATASSLLWPLPHSIVHPDHKEPARITDRHGTLLYEVRDASSGDHDPLRLDQIPKTLIDALIATEDRRFRWHPGVDPIGLARAVAQNISAGRIVSGASTITQQLIRIRRGSTDRSPLTKILEMRDALRLEYALTKDEILESYLNSAYFGHQAYGIESAARTFFGKNVSELSLSEQTLLIGLLQSPSAYNPFRNWDRAKKRQKAVLAAMVSAGKLTQQQADDAFAQEIRLGEDRVTIEAPHFVFWLQNKKNEVFKPGATVQSTLDLPLQQETERIIRYHLEKLKEQNVNSAAVVVLDARTGDVLTMVGSADYFDDEHDGSVNVTVASRQPGSTLKPFTYALALSGGDTLATTVADIEERYFTEEGNPYTPRNYDYEEHGLVRYREALANSYNIAAVKVLGKVGVERLMRLLQGAGITTLTQSPEHYGLALTLGDAEVKLLELAQAYAVFAREAETLPLRSLLDDPVGRGRQIIDPRVAWLIASALSDDDARVAEFGVNGPLSFPFPVGVKTGTTRNGRDNWTMAFTPDRVVGVWVGNPDNTPMRNISGVTGAAPIMHDVMMAAHKGLPPSDFVKPSEILSREICRLSGKLPGNVCPEKMTEWFIAGTEPTEEDTLWKKIRLDRRNGLLAGDGCPGDVIETKTYALFPTELRSWADEHGWPSPPARYSPFCPRNDDTVASGATLRISWPHDGDTFELDPLVPDERETITFRAEADSQLETVEWRVNGDVIGTGVAPDFGIRWKPEVGTWTVEVRAQEMGDRIQIVVEK